MIKKIGEWFSEKKPKASVPTKVEVDAFLHEQQIVAKTFIDQESGLHLGIPYAAASLHVEWEHLLKHMYPEIPIHIATNIPAHAVRAGLKPLPQVRNMIAVASGKGGVGKSTTAANLALALQQEGARVGLVDADVYGPSQVLMMGLAGQKPEVTADKKFIPLEAHGLQIMSMGALVADEQAMAWRGPMASRAMQQLIEDTAWVDLDYLIIDMPPGTGDLQLTLAQKIPVTAAVIVTTPQDVALLDVHKSMTMFQKVQIPVLGVVENMSIHRCSQCGHEEHIFGEGGALRLAQTMHVEVLAHLPLKLGIRQAADAGMPYVMAQAASPEALIYRQLAHCVGKSLAGLRRDYSAKMPQVTIQSPLH